MVIQASFAFFSRKLNAAEWNYHVGHKALLSTKAALEKWHHWLERTYHPFQVITDHKNLEYIKGIKRLNPHQHTGHCFSHASNSRHLLPRQQEQQGDALSRRYDLPHADHMMIPFYHHLSSFPPSAKILCKKSREHNRRTLHHQNAHRTNTMFLKHYVRELFSRYPPFLALNPLALFTGQSH